MTLYIFDMDGTLTEPGLPMDPEFATFFHRWQQSHQSYIATCSGYDKVTRQLNPTVLNAFSGIYTSMGNELIAHGKVVYQKEFTPPAILYEKLEEYRKNTTYPHKLYPNYIEKRIGMINFSVLGRACPQSARLEYAAWDNVSKEREKIRTELAHLFPKYDIAIGGTISLDITPKGCGKEQIATHLRNLYPNEEIIFVGDKTLPGGNDYKLAHALSLLPDTRIIQVNSLNETLNFLKTTK